MNRNKTLLLFIITILSITNLFSQDNGQKIVWIYLKPQYIEKNSELKIHYSHDKLLQLQRNNWQEDFSDYLPSDEIRQQIEKNVIKIRHYSRSLCAFSAIIDNGMEASISSLPFVEKIQDVGIRSKKRLKLDTDDNYYTALKKSNDFYGTSLDQLEQLNVVKVHEQYTGKGVRIAVIDAGFRKDHETFNYLRENGRLVDEYDFIYDDKNVQDEIPADTTYSRNQHSHGTAVLSCIAGYVPNMLIGTAYDVEVLLAKTEVEGSETRIEEDNYVAAVEWAEENGADIISSSLGYRDFDNFEYPYSDLDGETAVTTRAANWAFNRGVLVVTAAGNDAGYFSDGGLITPGDSWGALTVGAVDAQGEIASFSSFGPTYDGRQKPEVCARGYNTWVASDYQIDAYRKSNGTSFSTPLMAGCCALILEKFPYWTPSQVIENLKKFSDRSELYDRKYGWGIPDIFRLITETTDTTEINIEVAENIVVAPNPVRSVANFYFRWKNPNLDANEKYVISVYSLRGEKLFSQSLIGKGLGSVDLVSWDLKNKLGNNVSSGIYFVEITGEKMHNIKKFTVLK